MKLARRVERMFHNAWKRIGQPEMKVVRPVADWNLPVGYTYDQTADIVEDDDGVAVSDLSPYQTFDMVPMMPGGIEFTIRGQQDQNLVLTPAGMAPNNIVVARVLPAFSQILEEAFAVQIDGDWYDVNGVNHLPEGAPEKAWLNVTLRRR